MTNKLLTDDQAFDVLQEAIDEYGPGSQILMCIEELGELQHELIKLLRHNNFEDKDRIRKISEEMADVRLCLVQVCLILDNSEEEFDYTQQKLLRLKIRLADAKK